MAGNAVIGLLSPPAHISAGESHLNGTRIDHLQGEAMRRLRGKDIGMVFQDPLTSLNPLLKIGDQLTETMLAHLDISQAEARKRAVAIVFALGPWSRAIAHKLGVKVALESERGYHIELGQSIGHATCAHDGRGGQIRHHSDARAHTRGGRCRVRRVGTWSQCRAIRAA